MTYDPTATGAETRLNELYWNSSQTIDEILAEAGVGRNVLYAAIEPLNAGSDCPTCAEVLFFTNRTNRASGSALCLGCGHEVMIPDAFATRQDADGNSRPRHQWAGDHATRPGEEWRSISTERAALIGGAAALGLLVGAAAAKALRH